ncbi:flagellar basal body rod protein FlgB [Ideonella livida]|uniref:Flagellar basal body rod protein FlgB n=1 Tax=Ideonella livida TaxID=2707176 RepID=A0A7C9TGS4_9BURK|nr:flagellar basal body protein [Ideonella livida]NDY89961.1 flagellar basal body rod protein FlgB [Ideonella livida]
MLERLTRTLDFQAQALQLRAERQRLLASNIANADTPGYVALEMDFSQALRQATASGPPGSAGGPAGTGPAHLAAPTGLSQAGPAQTLAATQAGHLPLDLREREGASTLRFAAASQTNLDSNTVDMDRERASFAENSVKYEATLRFLNSSVKTTLDAMKSHTQG